MTEPATGNRVFRVGGVPEHFNLPWHLTIEAATGSAPLSWTDFATGTGTLLAELAAGRLDAAVLLTEGAALGLARGLPIEPLSLYTTSSLIWGVHCPPALAANSVAALRGRRFAISRHGSGSHLMSLALALAEGWPVAELQFELVDDLNGAIRAFSEGRADVFLWERFTTAPYVETGVFRRVGEFVSPWPAWVVCLSSAMSADERAQFEGVFRQVADQADRLQRAPDRAALISRRYGLGEAAVTDWLARTEWVAGPMAPMAALAAARRMLAAAGALPR